MSLSGWAKSHGYYMREKRKLRHRKERLQEDTRRAWVPTSQRRGWWEDELLLFKLPSLWFLCCGRCIKEIHSLLNKMLGGRGILWEQIGFMCMLVGFESPWQYLTEQLQEEVLGLWLNNGVAWSGSHFQRISEHPWAWEQSWWQEHVTETLMIRSRGWTWSQKPGYIFAFLFFCV